MEGFINALTSQKALDMVVFLLCAFVLVVIVHLARDLASSLFSGLGGLFSGSFGSKSGSRGKKSGGSKGGSSGKSGGSRGGSGVASGAGDLLGGTLSGVGAIAKGVGEGVGAAGKGAGKRMSGSRGKHGSDGGAGIGAAVGGFIGGVVGAAVGGTWAATKAAGSKAKAKAQAANTRFEQSAKEAGREEAQAERPTSRRRRRKQRRQARQEEVIDAQYTDVTEKEDREKLPALVAVVETDNERFISRFSASLAGVIEYDTQEQGDMTVFLVEPRFATFASELAQVALASLDGHFSGMCQRCQEVAMTDIDGYCHTCAREMSARKQYCRRCRLESITYWNEVLGMQVCQACDDLHQPKALPELPSCGECGEAYDPFSGPCCIGDEKPCTSCKTEIGSQTDLGFMCVSCHSRLKALA